MLGRRLGGPTWAAQTMATMGRSVLLRAGTLLAVALGSMASMGPFQARGACGDWLAHGDAIPSNATQLETQQNLAALGTETFGPAGAPAAPRPCHGRGCRNAPQPPAMPMPWRWVSGSDDGTPLLPPVSPSAGLFDPGAVALEEGARALAGHARRIEHPPRG